MKHPPAATKRKAKGVNVDVAPFNQIRLEALLRRHNDDPERSSPPLKYTDVVNAALDAFFTSTDTESGKETET